MAESLIHAIFGGLLVFSWRSDGFAAECCFFGEVTHFWGLKRTDPCDEVSLWRSDVSKRRLCGEMTLVWRSDAYSGF